MLPCRFLALDQVDQEAMLAIRTAWFEECGGPPIGNKREWPASAGDCRAWLQCADLLTW